MTDLFYKLRYHLSSNFPFAIYSKPGSSTITGIFQKDGRTDLRSDLTEEGFVFAPFHDGETLFIPARAADVVTGTVDFEIILKDSAVIPTNLIAKEDFEGMVSDALIAINQGQFQKVVLSRKLALDGSLDMEKTFKNILKVYPKAFRYCFYHPVCGLWMGATPEQLLHVEGKEMKTVALAGTQIFKEVQEAVWEEKERQEQKFVTDFITDSIGDFVTDIDRTEPYTFRAGNIVHIKTDISGRLKDVSKLKEVIQALHPTPAICGVAREDALKFILHKEKYDREYYSGFLGEVNCKDDRLNVVQTDLFVNLRCMKLEDGKANLYVGCGITEGSNPEKEYVETVNKAATMASVLTN
ncbi:MAG: isochorismate synthase [Flavobacterium sp.]|nr:MAG: isochorismate synthase [Flavobacterium sp.]